MRNVVKMIFSACAIAHTAAFAQASDTHAYYSSQDQRLNMPCVSLIDANGSTSSAWIVTLQLQTETLLRLTGPTTRLDPVPGNCHDAVHLSADGKTGDLRASGITVDSMPGVTFTLHARATLPPAPYYDFNILSLTQQTPAPVTESFSLVFSASNNGQSKCSFGNVENCRLFRARVALLRDAAGKVASLAIDPGSFTELMPDTGAVMADVSPDGTHVAFLYTGPNSTLKFRNSYVMNLTTGSILNLTGGQNHSGEGDWPHWLSDTSLMYSNRNYCPDGSNSPGCSINSRYSDLMRVTLSSDRSHIVSTDFLFGDIDAGGMNSRACDASDSVRSPASSKLIAFHSTTIDGKSSVRDDGCPWVAGLPGINGEPYAGPKPVVLDLDSLAGKPDPRSMVAGKDYFLMDMTAVGINSLAHLHFATSGIILGTEQNTVVSPMRECSISSVALTQGLQACINAGGKVILYNRIFGFENTGTRYENVRRATDVRLPLFSHKSPSELPQSARYFNASAIGANFQYKYAEFVNADKTLLATVMSHNTNDTNMAFSRLMLIDIADPERPYYFDLTGWLEDNFPSRWPTGTAEGFTGTSLP